MIVDLAQVAIIGAWTAVVVNMILDPIVAGLRAVIRTGVRECPDCGQWHR